MFLNCCFSFRSLYLIRKTTTAKESLMLQDCGIKYREPDGGHLFSVVLAGDVCPGKEGEELTAAGRSAEIMAAVSEFVRSADLRLVQWETPTVLKENPIPKSGPNLNSAPETIQIVRDAGFDVALLANNHIGDHGTDGVLETLQCLHKSGMKTVGAGKNLDEANRPLALFAGGKKILLLNFAENEFGTAGENKPGVAPQSTLRNLKQTQDAAGQADFVIVVLHGGHEHNPFPSPRLQELCRAFADAEADLVFNCHTHCPEGVELYNGSQIIYSPGNFYFPKYNRKLWNTGYLAKCFFDRMGVYQLELLPYHFGKEHVTPLDAAGRKAFDQYMERLCEPLSKPERIRKLFEAWSTEKGRAYLVGTVKGLPENWENRLEEPEVVGQLLHLRNIFTCEAHNDMVKCYLRLIEEYRLEEAAKLLPEILSFADPEWMAAME